MTNIKKGSLFRLGTIYLILSFSIIAILPSRTLAIFVPSIASQGVSVPDRSADVEKVQQVLESKVINQRLTELGLDVGEIESRLGQLTDEEIHRFATQLESLHAGGETTGVIISLLIIVILVLVILQLTGHKIIVQ
ncbi:MAG: PA2779 family protein [Thermodesulfobacteriota bacterium]